MKNRFAKTVAIGIRVTEDERAMFHELAERLKKPSYGEAVRMLVTETVKLLREQQETESTASTEI